MSSQRLGIVLSLALLGAVASVAMAQVNPTPSADSTSATAAPQPAAPAPPTSTAAPAAAPTAAPAAKAASRPSDNIYYGGTVTLGFGSTTTIGVFPMMGYKLTPKLSGGAEAGYEYVSYSGGHSTNNYGAGVFARYRVNPNLYAHVEYQSINYEIFESATSSSREWVPALLVGGGLLKPLNARTAAYVEVLFDVLQDDNSPYKNWEPVVSVGVSVGF